MIIYLTLNPFLFGNLQSAFLAFEIFGAHYPNHFTFEAMSFYCTLLRWVTSLRTVMLWQFEAICHCLVGQWPTAFATYASHITRTAATPYKLTSRIILLASVGN